MLLQFFTAVMKNAQFESALDRTLRDRKILQSRLKAIESGGHLNKILLGIFDKPQEFFEVKRVRDDALEVNVGYSSDIPYQRDDDDKVIGLIAGWLHHAIQEIDGDPAKRQELLSIVHRWADETVVRIISERQATNGGGSCRSADG
jgi:hypothetical protein